jgi:hypothetical protein
LTLGLLVSNIIDLSKHYLSVLKLTEQTKHNRNELALS